MLANRVVLLSIGFLVFGLLSACNRPAQDDAAMNMNLPSAANVYANYVVLASGSKKAAAYARVIQDDTFDCPSVATTCGSGTPMPMTARDKPRFDSLTHCPPHPTTSQPSCFPVKVCEAAVALNRKHQICLNGSQIDLPNVADNPTKVLVMGDTGCKSVDRQGGDCDCKCSEQAQTGDTACKSGAKHCNYKNKNLAEPFATLVAGSGTDFDLIVHMGDYNYRGTPEPIPWDASSTTKHWAYDAGDGIKSETCGQSPSAKYVTQASSGSHLPDQWQIWQKEFFDPARNLLAAAPWIFARGNHELCSRAGPGWFYFLDAGFKPDNTQIDCPALPSDQDNMLDPFQYSVIAPPYRVDLDTFHMIVIDSANACDDHVSPGQFETAYAGQFASLKIPQTGTTWIMSHRPFWLNKTLQSAAGTGLGGIGLSLAGHKHLFESFTPTAKSSLPVEVVAGNGGVSLFGDSNSCNGKPKDNPDVWVQGAAGYGFLHVQLDAGSDSWSGELLGFNTGTPMASCGSANSPSVCTVAGEACQ